MPLPLFLMKTSKEAEQMTFSIVGRCAETGRFGMAVSSSSPAVAARCAHARAGVGAVASQNVTDRAGPASPRCHGNGAGCSGCCPQVIDAAEHTAYRQVLAVDSLGRTAIFSGTSTLGVNAEFQSENAAARAICSIIRAFPKPWSRFPRHIRPSW